VWLEPVAIRTLLSEVQIVLRIVAPGMVVEIGMTLARRANKEQAEAIESCSESALSACQSGPEITVDNVLDRLCLNLCADEALSVHLSRRLL
jgi:hypothetical protein